MATTQTIVPQTVLRTRRPSLCGKCKCPGHRANQCNVIKVIDSWNAMKNEKFDMTLSPEERFAIRINNQANVLIKEIRKINRETTSKPLKFREKYIEEYLNKEENQDVEPEHIPKYRREYAMVSYELNVALKIKKNKPSPAIWALDGQLKIQLIQIWVDNYSYDQYQASTRRKELAHNRKVEEYERIQRIRERGYIMAQQSLQALCSQNLQVNDKVIDETTCPICLEELTDCNKLVSACGHQFHANCIIKMSMTTTNANKNKCPCCRSEMF